MTYFEITLFINRICNKGPSNLVLFTNIPLKQKLKHILRGVKAKLAYVHINI